MFAGEAHLPRLCLSSDSLGCMHASINWPRIEEPFYRTLARNLAIAVVVATVFAFVRHDLSRFLPIVVLALWPSLGGHYIEVAFVNVLRDRIPQGDFAQAVSRLLVWFLGGVLLYCGMALSSRVLPLRPLPFGLCVWGGLLFVGLELAVHLLLAVRSLDSFYNRRG